MKDSEISMDEVRRLVGQAQTGNESAFGELMQMYHQRVFSLTYSYVNNSEDAKELSQQAWIKAWNKLGTFKGESEFFTWMYRLASFVCLDYLRKRKRQREEAFPESGREPAADPSYERSFSSNPRPDRQAAHAEIRRRFEEAMKTLTPEHRAALVLREVEGLSYEEIAKVMKCRKGTVMSRIFYARRKLQELMGDFK
jgi:RNA polymerase sigma-70 factor (ECF subfamily)